MKLGNLSLSARSIDCLVDKKLSDENAYSDVPKAVLSSAWLIDFVYIHKSDDIYQKDIERCFSITRSAASKILIQLEKLNVIERHRVSHDARLKKLEFTEQGMKYAVRIHSEAVKVENEVFGCLSAEEAHTLAQLMRKITNKYT